MQYAFLASRIVRMSDSLRSSFTAIVLLTLTLTAAAQTTLTPVYIDDSPAAQDLIDEARHLRSQDRLDDAAAKFQQVLDELPYKLMRIDGEIHTDTHRWVRRQIRLDDALLKAYRARFEPVAQRMLAQATEEASPGDAYQVLVNRFILCRSGLEAALRLAAMELEQGAAGNAASVLDDLSDHPDLAEFAVRHHLLAGACGVFTGDAGRYESNRAALTRLGAVAEATKLASWQDAIRLPAAEQVFNGLSIVPDGHAPMAMDAPLWTANITSADDEQSLRGRGMMQGVRMDGLGRDLLLPTISGESMFVNDTESVVAMDRTAGHVHWVYAPEDSESANAGRTRFGGVNAGIIDERGVAAAGSRLLTILGQASNFRPGWRFNLSRTSLVCLSADDGRQLWRKSTSELDEALQDAFFHGTPIIDQDRAYVTVRRHQMSGFHGAFIVAVDLRDGRLLWRRHLASAAVGRGQTVRLLSCMTLVSGRLYVSDNLGSVACLDGRSGSVIWLSVLKDSPESRGMAVVNPKQLRVASRVVRPMLVKAGLIVPGSSPNAVAVLLDPLTGVRLRDLSEEGFDHADMLVETPAGVLSVGQIVQMFDGNSLEPLWKSDLGVAADGNDSGHPAITSDRIFLPLSGRLFTLDAKDGKVLSTRRIDAAGNVLVTAGRMYVADASTVRLYMAWDDAIARLNAMRAIDPHDVRPGLAMAHLGVLNGRWPTVLAGVDAAMSAIQKRTTSPSVDPAVDAIRQEVFDEVRGIVEPDSLARNDRRRSIFPRDEAAQPEFAMRRALFERLASASATPADEVAYQFGFGRFLADTGEVHTAVDHYQMVLSDPTLAGQLFQHGNGSRQARLEATLRLRQLADKYPGIYDRYDIVASQRLSEMTSNPQVAPEALIELAMEFPLSGAAATALLEAGRRYILMDQREDAGSQLRRAYQQTQDAGMRAIIVGMLVDNYDRLDRPRQARQWLRTFKHNHPGIDVIRVGKPYNVDAWLADLSGRISSEGQLPSLTLPLGQPQVIHGRLLTPTRQQHTQAGDMLLVRRGPMLALYRGTPTTQAWQTRLPDGGEVALLSLTHDQAVLWQADQGRIIVLDTRNGEPVWPHVDVAALIDEVGGEAQRLAIQPAAQRQFNRIINPGNIIIRNGRLQVAEREIQPGLMVAVSEMVICLADHGGRMVAIDRGNGRVLWRKLLLVNRLDHLTIDDQTLAAAGVVGPPNDTQSGSIVVLDPLTGESRLPASLEDKSEIAFLGLGGEGLLLYATSDKIAAHRTINGEVAWRVPITGRTVANIGIAARDSMLLMDDTGGIMVVDLIGGRIAGRVAPPSQFGGAPRFVSADERWYVLTAWQASCVGADGKLVWRDAIASSGRSFVHQLVGDQHVALLAVREEQAPGDMRINVMIDPRIEAAVAGQAVARPAAPQGEGWSYYLYLLDRQGGAVIQDHELGPIHEVIDGTNAAFVDNRLVFTTESTTIVIPGAPR